jgi:excisionase family DNA binding protein
MEPLEHLFSSHQLAEYLDVPITTLYHWRQQREGPPAFKVGKHLRYRASDVEKWIRLRLDESATIGASGRVL